MQAHIYELPQNELGISCQNPSWRLHSPGNLDKKRSWHTDSIPVLRILRHVLGDRRHRWATALCSEAMYIPTLQNWERTKPIRPLGHLSLPKMYACLSWRKWPNSTLVQPTRDCQGQRRCDGNELQCCINMLRCLHSLGFPRVDYTHSTCGTHVHCHSTQWTTCQPTSWSWTSCTINYCHWSTWTFRPTITHPFQIGNFTPWDHRSRHFGLQSPPLEQQLIMAGFDEWTSRQLLIISWRPFPRPTSWRLFAIPLFSIRLLQIALVNATSLWSTL